MDINTGRFHVERVNMGRFWKLGYVNDDRQEVIDTLP